MLHRIVAAVVAVESTHGRGFALCGTKVSDQLSSPSEELPMRMIFFLVCSF